MFRRKKRSSEKRLDVDKINKQRSRKSGVAGIVETLARNFQTLSYVLFIAPLFFIYALCLTVALTPGAFLILSIWKLVSQESLAIQALSLALGFAGLVLTFILSLLIIVPIVNFPFLFIVKPYRGPWFSLDSLPWLYHNALMYLVRYTVLDLVTPTPLSLAFLKAMGMKIGKHSMINTSNISDPCLIEIGDYVTIGGSVYMMAHYGMNGFLIIDRLKIRKKANVGLHAYLMGAVEIGEGAKVLPNTMVLPKTHVPADSSFSNYKM